MNRPCDGESWSMPRTMQPARIAASSRPLKMCWPGNWIGRLGISVLELAEGDVRAPEGDRADHRREEDRDQDVERDARAPGRDVPELRPGDQRRRAAADAVVEGDHLRHLGHLHAERGDHPDGGPDQRSRPAIRPPVADHVRASSVIAIAIAIPAAAIRLPRRAVRRVGPLPDAEDEQGEGDDVAGGDEVAVWRQRSEGCHSTGLPRASRSAGSASVFGFRLPAAEHAEHAVGDHEAADDVDRAEGDRDRCRSPSPACRRRSRSRSGRRA